MLNKLFVAALMMVAGASAASARTAATASVWFHVSPLGDDSGNDCLSEASPCRTVQYAVERVKRDWDFEGYQPFIKLAAGVYDAGALVSGQPVGYYLVNIVGQQSEDQSCTLSQAQQVIVEGTTGEAIFDVQDLGVAVIRCLTLRAKCVQFSGGECVQRASGVNGVNCRQTPAVDLAYIVFDVLSTAVVSAQACGEINMGGALWIGNNIRVFLSANGLSQINVSVPVTALKPVNVTYYALSYHGANIFIDAPVVNVPYIAPSPSLVFRGGRIITNGNQLPGACSQAHDEQPGFCY